MSYKWGAGVEETTFLWLA